VITGQVRSQDILRALSKELGLPVSTLRREVEQFRTALANVGLIEGVAGGTVLKESMFDLPSGLRLFMAAKPRGRIRPTGGSGPP
jgi:hypothetical protein